MDSCLRSTSDANIYAVGEAARLTVWSESGPTNSAPPPPPSKKQTLVDIVNTKRERERERERDLDFLLAAVIVLAYGSSTWLTFRGAGLTCYCEILVRWTLGYVR